MTSQSEAKAEAEANAESSQDDLIERFDTTIATFWLLIGIGAAKSVEYTLQLVAAEFVTVTLFGMDITMIALHVLLLTAGTTGLIAWRTIH